MSNMASQRQSNIQVALTAADREHQDAVTALTDLQNRLSQNKTKISSLLTELRAAQTEVDNYSRSIPQVERQRTRADLQLRRLREHADRLARELASERRMQEYLEELQRADEDEEKRLKDYVSEVLTRDAEGYGDSDSESEWSVLERSIHSDTLKNARVAPLTPRSPPPPAPQPQPPVNSSSVRKSDPIVQEVVTNAATAYPPAAPSPEVVENTAVVQHIEASRGSHTEVTLEHQAAEEVEEPEEVEPCDDRHSNTYSDAEEPEEAGHEAEITIMYSDSASARSVSENDVSETEDEDHTDNGEYSAAEFDEATPEGSPRHTPIQSRTQSPEQAISPARSRASVSSAQDARGALSELIDAAQGTASVTSQEAITPPRSRSPSPKIQSPLRSPPLNHVYPPVGRSAPVLAPTPIRPISMGVPEAPIQVAEGSSQPQPMKYTWTPVMPRDSLLLKLGETAMANNNTPTTRYGHMLSRSPQGTYGSSGSDSDSPRGQLPISPSKARPHPPTSPRAAATYAFSPKRVPPPAVDASTPTSPLSPTRMSAKDFRDATAKRAEVASDLDAQLNQLLAMSRNREAVPTSPPKRVGDETAYYRARPFLQRPTMTVNGPRPRESSSAVVSPSSPHAALRGQMANHF